jgi:perosamine synthetase
MKLKVIITGGTGLLASNIAIYKRNSWNILLLTRSHTLTMDGVATAKADLIDLEGTRHIFESFDPDLVIHTAGLTDVEACEKNYYEAHLANTVTARNVAILCDQLKYKMVHISTDHFAAEKLPLSSEQDISLPVNVYAETKLQAEVEVLRHAKSALIVRTNFFGWGHNTRKSFSDFIIENLRANKEVTLFDDVFYTPINTDELADSIEALHKKSETGIFNICSNKSISKHAFGVSVAEVFELNKSLIKKGSIDNKPMTKRPKNMALSNSRMVQTLGASFDFDIERSLQKIKNLEFEGRKEALTTAVHQSNPSKSVLYYGKQLLDTADIDAVVNTLMSPHLTQGPKVQEFEKKISHYTGAQYSVTFANLTCGLHAAYLAMGVLPGDYIITSPITFVATSNAALYCGATPLFVDIDATTLNLDPVKLEAFIAAHPEKHKIKAIVPVHFAGHPCDMEAICKIAKKYGIKVFEDAAHAIGGSYLNSKKIGPYEGSIGAGFSFHPVKNITTGEGAAICTNDPEFYQELCRIRSHGITKGNDPFTNMELAFTDEKQNPWYYEMQMLGYNYRLTDIQCALGISQMDKLDAYTSKKRHLGKFYDENLRSIPHLNVLQKETRHLSGNHLYVAHINFKAAGISRRELFAKMLKDGISLHVHYIPVFYQPYYIEKVGTTMEGMENSIHYYEGVVTLPLYPGLKDSQAEHVVQMLRKNLVKDGTK